MCSEGSSAIERSLSEILSQKKDERGGENQGGNAGLKASSSQLGKEVSFEAKDLAVTNKISNFATLFAKGRRGGESLRRKLFKE